MGKRGYATPQKQAHNFYSRIGEPLSCGCLPWIGAKDTYGYGVVMRRENNRRVHKGAHRVAWELSNGQPVPEGLVVLHSCDNPGCVNPAHLSVGTKQDNSRDMAAKGRGGSQRRSACVKGHQFTPENTRVAVSAKGGRYRMCLTCRALTLRKYQQMRSLRPIKEDVPDLLSSEYRHWLNSEEEKLRRKLNVGGLA